MKVFLKPRRFVGVDKNKQNLMVGLSLRSRLICCYLFVECFQTTFVAMKLLTSTMQLCRQTPTQRFRSFDCVDSYLLLHYITNHQYNFLNVSYPYQSYIDQALNEFYSILKPKKALVWKRRIFTSGEFWCPFQQTYLSHTTIKMMKILQDFMHHCALALLKCAKPQRCGYDWQR